MGEVLALGVYGPASDTARAWWYVSAISVLGAWGGRGQRPWIPGAHWPTGLPTTVSSWFSESLNTRKQRWKRGEDI